MDPHLGPCDGLPYLSDGIDICRDAGDPVLNKPCYHWRLRTCLTADGTLDPVVPADLDGLVVQCENGRMLRLVHAGNILVVPVNGKGILDEVVGPERGEIDPGMNEIFYHDGARRYLTAEKHSIFKEIVSDGVIHGAGMPRLGDLLTEQDAHDIHAYIIARANEDRAAAAAAKAR